MRGHPSFKVKRKFKSKKEREREGWVGPRSERGIRRRCREREREREREGESLKKIAANKKCDSLSLSD